jgi:AraC family transcriptional regulator
MLAQSRPTVRTYQPGAVMAPHDHDEPSFSLVVHGGFLEHLGRRTRDYTRGHVAFFPAGVPHAQSFGPLGARQITIRPESAWIDYLVDCKVPIEDAPHANSAIFRRLGDRLLQELAQEDDFTPVACHGLMLEAVAALGRANRPLVAPGRPPAWLRVARDYVHENALRPVTLKEVALAVGRHEIHLAREFGRYYGVTIGACLRRLRAQHAARLLESTGAGLTQVALESGFSSHAHLCREFKAQLGMTPSKYREHAMTGMTRPRALISR